MSTIATGLYEFELGVQLGSLVFIFPVDRGQQYRKAAIDNHLLRQDQVAFAGQGMSLRPGHCPLLHYFISQIDMDKPGWSTLQQVSCVAER